MKINEIKNTVRTSTMNEFTEKFPSAVQFDNGSFAIPTIVEGENGENMTLYVGVEFTVKQEKDTARTKAFNLEDKVNEWKASLIEKENEKARKAQEKEKAKQEREAKKKKDKEKE